MSTLAVKVRMVGGIPGLAVTFDDTRCSRCEDLISKPSAYTPEGRGLCRRCTMADGFPDEWEGCDD
jgi:formylmethanofuran dehydrogenase subunit E